MKKKGTVILVGAGPGSSGLLTLRGAEAIRQADTVVHDRLVSDEILAMIPDSAERIDVGKSAGDHPVKQSEINRILVDKALEGRKVVRLKGGDPFVFGRGGEELELLAENGIDFEVIPGVTSAVGALSAAGIPVTHRDFCSSFHVITGHARKGKELYIDFDALVRLDGTLIFLMGLASMPQLMDGLLDAGMDPDMPAAAVENGTRPDQRKVIATVSSLAGKAAHLHSPVIIAVGRVCALAERFDWMSRKPLFGRKILVTRSAAAPGRLAALLREEGADVIGLPTIDIKPLGTTPAVSALLSSLNRPGWLLFSGKTAVELFMEQLLLAGKDLRALAGWKIAAVGKATAAALREAGLIADLVPDTFDGRHLGEALRPLIRSGERVVSLESVRSAGGAASALADAPVELTRIPLYDTVAAAPPPQEESERLLRQLFDHTIPLVAFSSASMAENFAAMLQCSDFTGISAMCIGAQTAAKARELGFSCTTAGNASMESMLRQIKAFFNTQSERN